LAKISNLYKSKTTYIISIASIAIIFYFLGYFVGHKNLVFENNYKPKVANTELMKPKEIDFSLFWEAWKKVTDDYAGKVDTQKMVYGSINGMIQSLGDPYSAFMEPGKTKNFMEDLSGEIQGIGAEVSTKNGKIVIVSPLEDSPAKKAGLKANDFIVKINGESTEKMSLDEAVDKIRGKAGTKVIMTIVRSEFSEPKDYEIERQKIKVKSVTWEMKPNKVAYIQITQFGEDTSPLIQEAVEQVNKENPKAVILDLRDNPGGYLDAAVDVTSLFMDPGVVVKEEMKDGKIEEEKTTLNGILTKPKMIILTNGGSASGSEIVAGALQDIGRATLLGEKTFGKGSVQTLENLSKGATLRLTTAKWLTPKGRAINGVGIEPDVKIELTKDDYENNRDPQLDKALEMASK